MNSLLLRILSLGETLAFIAAAIVAAIAEGKVDSPTGHVAVILGGIGAALHGLIHNPPADDGAPHV